MYFFVYFFVTILYFFTPLFFRIHSKTFTQIEIIPKKNECDSLINLSTLNENYKEKNIDQYFHIFFNDNKKETKNKFEIIKNDDIEIIKIIKDYQVESLECIFSDCCCIKSINFKKFYKNNIINISYMFSDCLSLEELFFSNFNTENVKNMYSMFRKCDLLNEINLFKFNTENVNDMSYMFYGCYSLNKLNLPILLQKMLKT